MEHLKKRAQSLLDEINQAVNSLGLEAKQKELEKLRSEMTKSDFWQDNKQAQDISKQEAELSRSTSPWLELQKSAKELIDLSELNDQTMQKELTEQVDRLQEDFDELKKELRFQGPYDDHDVILSVYAGAGGTDAQDWAQMLLRMYVRWAEAHNLTVKTIDQSSGEEAGIKSVTIRITGGSYLYGKLAGEHGVHRLVRLSPFNADNLRQTSFAKVDILPEISRPEELKIDEKDLKIDTFRAGGRGGQSVNTTDSAVRITHTPTGISISIQNERSQLQNREMAMSILRSKLAGLQLEQHAESISQLKGPNQSAEWGNQIRNYVLHPYKQVKDTRTSYESSEVEKVLDGNLDPLIEAWVEQAKH